MFYQPESVLRLLNFVITVPPAKRAFHTQWFHDGNVKRSNRYIFNTFDLQRCSVVKKTPIFHVRYSHRMNECSEATFNVIERPGRI